MYLQATQGIESSEADGRSDPATDGTIHAGCEHGKKED